MLCPSDLRWHTYFSKGCGPETKGEYIVTVYEPEHSFDIIKYFERLSLSFHTISLVRDLILYFAMFVCKRNAYTIVKIYIYESI